MDTLSEKSPNQGENDDKMIELKDLVEPTSAASPAPVRPLSLSCDVENDATSNIDKEKASTTSSSEEEVSEESKDVVIEETTLEASETKVGASNEVEKKEDRESPILSSPAETLQTTIEPSLEVAQEAESDQVEVKLEVEADVNLMASEQSTKDEVEAKVDMEEIKNDLGHPANLYAHAKRTFQKRSRKSLKRLKRKEKVSLMCPSRRPPLSRRRKTMTSRPTSSRKCQVLSNWTIT